MHLLPVAVFVQDRLHFLLVKMFGRFRRRIRHTILQPPVGDLGDGIVIGSAHRDRRMVATTAAWGGTPGFRTRTRSDQPEVRSSGHADGSRAIAAAKDAESKKRALATLNKGMLAATSQAPQQALLRTWARYHHCWFGGITEPYPITVSSLRAVAAMFKAGGYSSFRNYVFAAKGQHIRLGYYYWDQCLDKTAKDCIRSVIRGLGPAKRTEPLDVNKAIEILKTWKWNNTDMDRPMDSLAMITTAIIFLCREIEISGALQHELEVADDGSSCTDLWIALAISRCFAFPITFGTMYADGKSLENLWALTLILCHCFQIQEVKLSPSFKSLKWSDRWLGLTHQKLWNR